MSHYRVAIGRLTAVGWPPFYRFEHIETYSSGKVVAKPANGHGYEVLGYRLSAIPLTVSSKRRGPRSLGRLVILL